MITFKNSFAAALLSVIAATSFAQAPSPLNDNVTNPPAAAMTAAGSFAKPVAHKPMHQVKKQQAKKHVTKHPKGAKPAKKHHKVRTAKNMNSAGPGKEAF